MSDTDLSKRERQKARRAARLEREAAAARAARRNRAVAMVAMVAVVLAGIGALVYRQIERRNARNALAVELVSTLEERGCTADDPAGEEMADLGGGHIASSPEALVAEPPATLYPDRPTSSGRHVGQVTATGVYDAPIDERITMHNLEHGYVVVWYAEDAPEDQVEAMKAWAQRQIDGDFPKMIVAPYAEDLSGETNFAAVGWLRRMACRDFDEDVFGFFTAEQYGTNGVAPEGSAGVTRAGQQGVLDPQGEPLLLPPLDAQLGTDSALDEAQDAGAMPDDASEGAVPQDPAGSGTEAPPEAATPAASATDGADAASDPADATDAASD